MTVNAQEDIKEWHFHVYFMQDNVESKAKALELHAELERKTKSGDFVAVPLKTINFVPRGPHLIGSFETWVPIEYFATLYQWFLLNRQGLSILVHPLTREEVRDHSERAVWMGTPLPLDLSKLTTFLDKVPAQYPEYKLGYSKS
ncbi:hypothetical protein PhCBS80983_g05109 [Powellomyces hirtus]|uniref:DOPA 4,5-dioxygenase n=1 Tax=Powellomyces hirtus TaxID=109895 RepID=A0A507DXU0_9FUNG|nr:hypothetical protein PhCBS80983_g05109 [Powellomyces hirtus]